VYLLTKLILNGGVLTIHGVDIKIGGSVVGSPATIREMLSFAALKNVRPRIEEESMKEANQVIKDIFTAPPCLWLYSLSPFPLDQANVTLI
jgi:D-arabinose 1-dehydrogenase-like Zn-dependent alcohol dehydrogenase